MYSKTARDDTKSRTFDKKYKKSYRCQRCIGASGAREIVGLLGPNGCWENDFFLYDCRTDHPNGGRIFLDDQEITKEPVYKRAQLGVGYLAQEASVFRRLSVEDNIRAVLEMTKMTKEEQKDRLEEMLDEFGLQHIRKKSWNPVVGEENDAVRKLPGHFRSGLNLLCWTSLLPV